MAIRTESGERFVARATAIADKANARTAASIDRLFVGLLLFQWAVALGMALLLTPYTWAGAERRTHPHVIGAAVLGTLIVAFPVVLGVLRPGQAFTRHVIAVGQMLYTSLLIHLSGGRIETHFHVFGSLAFLAFYRDWRVLVTATCVTAIDHIARGAIWPESIYGTAVGAEWRWLEHAGWVVFIDIFLVYSCLQGKREVREAAMRQAELEESHSGVERQVRERTASLRESEERLGGALQEAGRARTQLLDAIENLDSGFVMYDPEERLLVCNSRFREMYSRCADVLRPGVRYEEILKAIYAAGGHLQSGLSADAWIARKLDARRYSKDPGELRIGERWIRACDRRTADGGVVSLRTDVTDLHAARETAEAASRAKGEFLANMSHEIRTPMNGVLGLTELLLDTELSPEQRESLTLVKSSADALLAVINDILDFSKIEAGRMELESLPFEPAEVISRTVKAAALQAHAKNLELTFDITAGVPLWVQGDACRLRQVLTNLLGNAIKFTSAGEVVVKVTAVSGGPIGSRLHFSVADTGIGIPADKLATVFDAFTQADGSTTRRFGGTGLGLTISARLVALMGGRIWAESIPGEGSVFHFEADFAPATGLKENPPPPKLESLAGMRVLVVDDNSTNRRILEETLKKWSAQPTCVDSGPAALKELRGAVERGEAYPLVLLDACMPDMDGFEVAQSVSRRDDLAGAAIMMLSSVDRMIDSHRCQDLGLSAYLVKPVATAELLKSIAAVLAKGDDADRQSKPAVALQLARPARRLRVLLAEDNPVNQKVAVRMLEKRGHSVVLAKDGREAVAALSRERFDLVFMDIQMPNMDGYEATHAIREMERAAGRRTRIVAMTAHAMVGDREKCIAAGMDDYLSKPIRHEELDRTLDSGAAEPALPIGHPTGNADPGVFDRAGALERLGGDEELFDQIRTVFLEDAPRMVGEIRHALIAGDAGGVQRAAHGLKGAAGYLGAKAAVAASFRLETIGEAGELANAEQAFQTLETELRRLGESLAC